MAASSPSEVMGLLRGFSGSAIELRRSAGETRVRKYARTAVRMERELAKLERLQAISYDKAVPLFRVPALLAVHRQEPAYYEMAYIRGFTLEEQVQSCPVHEIEKWAERLVDIHEYVQQVPYAPKEEEGVFLRSYLDHLPASYPHRAQVMTALERVATASSFSHGDLTLDNILIGPYRQVHLIDPLYHGFDCRYWDLAKLFQSCYLDWWRVRGITTDRHQRLRLLARFLVRSLDRRGYTDWATVALYLAVVLLRIVPYAPQEAQKRELLEQARGLLDQFIHLRPLFVEELS